MNSNTINKEQGSLGNRMPDKINIKSHLRRLEDNIKFPNLKPNN